MTSAAPEGRSPVPALVVVLTACFALSCAGPVTEPGPTETGPTESATAGPAASQPPSTAPATTEPVPTEPVPTESVPTDDRPLAHNTGPTDVSVLEPKHQTIDVDEPGTVVENVAVIGGRIDIQASDVTVRNFRVDADGSRYGVQVRKGVTDVVIEYGEVTGSASAGVYCQSACTVRRLYVHDHASDGLKIDGENGPSLVEYNFVTRLGMEEGSHADGNQSVSASDLTFRFNNFSMPKPGTAAHEALPKPDGVEEFNSNAAFIIHDETDDILIENNWLNGGNYTVYGYHGTRVRNNVFGPDFRYGVCTGSFDEWSGNVMEDGTPAGEGSCG